MNDGGTPGDDAARKARAEADKAEADARKAALDAVKAEEEQEAWRSDLAKRQRDAETRKAIAEADKAARSAGTALDPAIERQKAEADARKAIAEADKATADAKRTQIAALIPDFSKIEKGETKVEGDQALYSSVLARHALEEAVKKLVDKAEPKLQKDANHVVLVTDDPDLATSDATYVEVKSGLDELISAANKLLETPPSGEEFGAAAPIVGAIAAAIPPLISLFSARRTASSFALKVDNTAAVAEVAGQLTERGHAVRLDDFRLVPDGQVMALERDLRERRISLVKAKLERDVERIDADTIRQSLQEEVDDLTKALHDLKPDDSDYEQTKANLTAQRTARDAAAEQVKKAAAAVALIGDVVTSIDAFLAAIHAVPAGGTRSVLVSAALREQLRTDAPGPHFSRVLFVNASTGSVDQLFSDRPLWIKDKFEAVATVSLTYWVIDAATSNVLVGAVTDGSARVKGELGGSISIKSITSS